MEKFNKVISDRINDNINASIENLFWLAASGEGYNIREFMEDLDIDHFEQMFPETKGLEWLPELIENDEQLMFFYENKKLGFIAEINIPNCSNFDYDDKSGKPTSWRVNGGFYHVEYIYSETLEGLVDQMEEISNKYFEQDIKRDKEKTKTA